MKNLFRLFWVMLASLSLCTSCTEALEGFLDDLDDEPIEGAVTFGASITSLQSKATGSSFDAGDEISVTAYLADQIYGENILYTYADNIFASTSPVILPEDGSSLSYRAVYPYVAMSDGVVNFSINTNQSGTNYTKSDLMSSSISATPQSSPSFTFNHLLSSIVVNISSESTLVGVDASVQSAASVEYDIVNNSVVSSGDIVAVTMNENGAYSYKAIVVPQTYNAGDIVATITIADTPYEVATPTDITLESGCQYTFSLTVETTENPSEIDVTFDDVVINDWGVGFELNWTVGLPSVESAMTALYDAMVVVGGYSSASYHYDFGYPALMIAYESMAANVISTSGDGYSGYDWFINFLNGRGLGYEYALTEFIWYSYQSFISLTNDIINIASASGDSSTEMMSYVAAAKSLRAMFYLDLARLYEPLANNYTDISAVEGLTVPEVSGSTTDADSNPRLSRDDMFAKIFEDLDDVESLYLDGGVAPLSARVPNLAVVYGLKARAYLWLGGFDASNYASAAEYARMAIDTSAASIMSEAQYCDVITGFNTPNSSWMLYANQLSTGASNLINFVAWLSSEATYGYGYYVAKGVSSAKYDRMSDTDFRKRLFLSGSPSYADYADVTLRSSDNFYTAYPYSALKFRPSQGAINDHYVGNITSIPLMRVEEMYLIEAEAKAHSSASEGVALLTSFMANRDSAYSFLSSDSAEIVEEIVFQKSVEFWGEGIYLFDAKRLGLGIDLGYDGSNAVSTLQFTLDGVAPWWNLPFPNSATDANSAIVNNPDPSKVYEEVLIN